MYIFHIFNVGLDIIRFISHRMKILKSMISEYDIALDLPDAINALKYIYMYDIHNGNQTESIPTSMSQVDFKHTKSALLMDFAKLIAFIGLLQQRLEFRPATLFGAKADQHYHVCLSHLTFQVPWYSPWLWQHDIIDQKGRLGRRPFQARNHRFEHSDNIMIGPVVSALAEQVRRCTFVRLRLEEACLGKGDTVTNVIREQFLSLV
jgi:hypothetical protein